MFDTILPIFFIFAIGFVSQRIMRFNIRDLSNLTIYVMTPFLCFHAFYTHPLSIADGYLFLATLVLFVLLIAIVYAYMRLLQRDQRETYAMILASVFMNSGNYGIPVVLLAFGEKGRNIAILLMVFHGIVINSLGVYLAAKGGTGSSSIGSSLRSVARMPILHGMVLGILLQKCGVSIPNNLMVSIKMVGDASIPAVMIILGMQLAMSSLKRVPLAKMSGSIVIRLIVSPFLAWVLAFWLPADPMVKQIFILSSGMPTAANTALLAIRFDTDPELVSSATFLSTILSIPSLAIILALIEHGMI